MSFNQFTVWNANDTRTHITVRMHESGVIEYLSRDKAKSVAPVWREFGAWSDNANGTKRVILCKVPNAWVFATALSEKGHEVIGVGICPFASIVWRETNEVTDPDTLLGNKRRRSLNLGIRAKCDPPADWRERAAALNAKRAKRAK